MQGTYARVFDENDVLETAPFENKERGRSGCFRKANGPG
jgi:hypothetical protein